MSRERGEPTPSEGRNRLLTHDLAAHGVHDPRVVAAMGRVARERFVDPTMAAMAYEDRPLPIGSGQTISQPAIVAIMAQAAEITPGDKVLEVGTGSGYGAAVLAMLASRVTTIERHRELAEEATRRLDEEGFDRVTVVVGDGTLGVSEEAPFDVIVVTAAGPEVPNALVDQLADGGRLIMPVGRGENQSLVRLRKEDGSVTREDLGPVRFVPLIGSQGWRRAPGFRRRGSA